MGFNADLLHFAANGFIGFNLQKLNSSTTVHLPDKLLEALLSYAKKTITHMNTDRESLVRNREEHEGIVGIKKG
jgi:hypothetical protein